MRFSPDRHFYEGLTRWNFLPNQKSPVGELPPCFTSQSFTPEICELLANIDDGDRKRTGYDEVVYSMTRHNNVPRRLGLVHPMPYSKLSRLMAKHWQEISNLAGSPHSAIKPEQHFDGRIFIMNYEGATTKASMALAASFGKRFRVESDVAGCFSSVYSHSIPWAIVGVEQAKASARGQVQRHWSDDLDRFQRNARRNETLGVSIGPATSSVIVEIILGKVDERLAKRGFNFRRFVDDYVCHCRSHDDATEFIRVLAAELACFKLSINLQKTTIVELPEPLGEDWVAKLGGELRGRLILSEANRLEISPDDVVQYLDIAVRLNKETPDGSVLRYAVGSLTPFLSSWTANIALEYVLNLAWHFPTLLPYVGIIAARDDASDLLAAHAKELNELVVENAVRGRSDGIAWPLYFIKRCDAEISREAVAAIIRAKDCVALTMLITDKASREELTALAKEILLSGSYERDQYWLFLYQMYLADYIECHGDDVAFPILRKYNVDFLPTGETGTPAQDYCDFIDNPFQSADFVPPPLDAWLASEASGGA